MAQERHDATTAKTALVAGGEQARPALRRASAC